LVGDSFILTRMVRVGLGYDSHRLLAGRPLVLGGVRIDAPRGLEGHSDADAVLHALTDAVLGAVAAGDIGELFPDTDPQWAGADSGKFLAHAVRLAHEKGYTPAQADVTVLAQTPRLAPYKTEMRTRIAQLLGLAVDDVSVKAKTNEQMGFIGRGEGIAAMAVVVVTDAS
jgi:2-C-methyl-D-erythritol 2,4-cyclodiphosphate synthase